MNERRQLKYENWDTLVDDLNALAGGCEQHAKWNLEQACRHLNDWLRYPLDGYDTAPIPMRYLLHAMRITVGPRLLARIIADSKMKDGLPTTPNTIYKAVDAQATQDAVSQLLDHDHAFSCI